MPVDADPRHRDDGLGWVTRALFDTAQQRVTLSEPGAGWRPVARFAVVPDVPRARFLLPLASPRVTAAALLAYNALRSGRTRVARALLGATARVGAARIPVLPRLTVAVPSGVDDPDAFVVHHLASRLGGTPLHAAIGVRPPDPHHKPTLQLFDGRGRPRGYAKIGWNDATRAMVRTEAAALAALPTVPDAAFPYVPRVLYAGDWSGRAVAVIDPLPPGVRRVPRDDWPYPAAMLAVAGAAGLIREPLAGFLDRLADRAAQARTAGCAAAERALAAIRVLRERHGAVRLEFGCWHGDWVPWNLGVHNGRLVAWDWEHHGTGVPVGFDLAHHGFQRALTLADRPAADATRAAATALLSHATALNLDPAHAHPVLTCYLLELWLRTWTLASGGAGWNPRLHPHLLDVVESRLREIP
jgi:hypothetical protein